MTMSTAKPVSLTRLLKGLWLCAMLWALASHGTAAGQGPAISAADQEFLDTLQERTFQFFWETANPQNGLVPDRWPKPAPSSVAAIGFGLSAYCVGAEREYVTREQAAERVLTTLQFLNDAAQSDDAGFGRRVSRVLLPLSRHAIGAAAMEL